MLLVLNVFIAFTAALIVLSMPFFTRYILIPLVRIYSLKRTGTEVHFFPIIGLFNYWKSSLKHTGDSMGYSKKSSKTDPHQKLLLSNLGKNVLINFRDVDYVKEFYKYQDCYEKASIVDGSKLLLGNGLLLAEGAMWKRHRKIISSSFHFEFLKSNITSIQEITKEHFEKLTTENKANFNILNEIQAITGETVGRLFFGKNLNNYTCEGKLLTTCLADLLADLENLSKSPPVVLFGPRVMNLPFFSKYNNMMKRVANFRDICKKIINERRHEPTQRNDMLGSLLHAQEHKNLETSFTDEEIVDEFVTFFAAGMDTTGHLIGMALYNLTLYPQYLETLKKERDTTYNLEVNVESLQKMDMLYCLLKETLRHYLPPSGLMIRKAVKSHKILDLNVKEGDLVRIDFHSIFVDERYFKNPDVFDPLRWKDPNQNDEPYSFTPFSAGPRNCIGQHLAIVEAKIIISEFLKKFDFKVKDENYKLEMTHRFLYEPLIPIVLEVTPKLVEA